MGRSLKAPAEIRRVRTDQIARLLVEFHISVNEIAALLGFPAAQHLSRYFRTSRQLRPLQYRRQFGSPALAAG